MRPSIRVAFLGLVIAAMIGAPAGAAARHRTLPAHHTAVLAAAGTARQGGTLLVVARVRLPHGARHGTEPSATAVVHFASGDVSVDLGGRIHALRGHWFGGRAWWAPVRVWRGAARVPVAADEQTGRVRIDVTISFGDGSVTVATVGRIRPARGQNPPTTDPDPVPCSDGCQET